MKVAAVVLLLLVVTGVVVDRVAVGFAEREVAEQLAAQEALSGEPDVDVRGFPFLTQALAGRYEEVRIVLTADGTVSLDGDELVIDVDRASGVGVDLPRLVVDRAADLLDLRYPLELPYGLRLTEVTPRDDGVAVRAVAEDALLAAE